MISPYICDLSMCQTSQEVLYSESMKSLNSVAWTSLVFSNTLLNFDIVITVSARPFQRDQI